MGNQVEVLCETKEFHEQARKGHAASKRAAHVPPASERTHIWAPLPSSTLRAKELASAWPGLRSADLGAAAGAGRGFAIALHVRRGEREGRDRVGSG